MKAIFQKINKQKGYTIIETMIAVSLFLIVVTAGTSALLNANSLYKKSQDMRSILDNLSFITEEMSRNLRTGSNYHCDMTPSETPVSCVLSEYIFFEESTTGLSGNLNDQWGYKIESPDFGATYNLSRTTDGGTNWTQLNSSEINFSSSAGFSVLGAEDLTSGNFQQPLVIIKLSGTITYKNNQTPFNIQTSVSQRLIDN